MGDETEAIGGTGEIGRWEAAAPAAMATLGGLTAHRLAVQARFGRPRAEHHRIFTPTIVPLGLVNTGPGFTEYRA